MSPSHGPFAKCATTCSTTRRFAWCACFCALLIATPTILAQSGGGYDLHWNTQDAGGSLASGNNGYSLAGTIGQPDASPGAPMTGTGNLVVRGGFWAGLHVGSDTIFQSGFETAP